jgi:Ras-related protein Rab-11A
MDSNIPVMLVGNKCDLREVRAASTDNGVGFSKNESLLLIETSALDSTNVTECFFQIITDIVHPIIKGDTHQDRTVGDALPPPGRMLSSMPQRKRPVVDKRRDCFFTTLEGGEKNLC